MTKKIYEKWQHFVTKELLKYYILYFTKYVVIFYLFGYNYNLIYNLDSVHRRRKDDLNNF